MSAIAKTQLLSFQQPMRTIWNSARLQLSMSPQLLGRKHEACTLPTRQPKTYSAQGQNQGLGIPMARNSKRWVVKRSMIVGGFEFEVALPL